MRKAEIARKFFKLAAQIVRLIKILRHTFASPLLFRQLPLYALMTCSMPSPRAKAVHASL